MKLQVLLLAALLSAVLRAAPVEANYRLGAGDRIAVYLPELKEIEIKPATIEADGSVELQHAGTIQAAGMTAGQLAREIESRLKTIVRKPVASVDVLEYGSQPVSVLGSVNRPGVHQLRGGKTLIEMLSLAEGLRPEAGNVIKITREKSQGEIPLAGARAVGEFYVAEVPVRPLLEGRLPEANIRMRPRDVVSAPRAEIVYVLGNVRKPGGFPLAERESLTVLQALSLAEGIQPASAPQSARILRQTGDGPRAKELAVNVKAILANKAEDQKLQPNDILYIPGSAAKTVGLRALEAGIQIGTGVVIWRRP